MRLYPGFRLEVRVPGLKNPQRVSVPSDSVVTVEVPGGTDCKGIVTTPLSEGSGK
ncbi:MAG: hypothetical protein M3458_14430 [Acidobacteriota bacterium]|nr:hypothetical protein [Acidobacteriota bacterium]